MAYHQFYWHPGSSPCTLLYSNWTYFHMAQESERSQVPETSSYSGWPGIKYIWKHNQNSMRCPHPPCMQLLSWPGNCVEPREVQGTRSPRNQQPISDVEASPEHLTRHGVSLWRRPEKYSSPFSRRPIWPSWRKQGHVLQTKGQLHKVSLNNVEIKKTWTLNLKRFKVYNLSIFRMGDFVEANFSVFTFPVDKNRCVMRLVLQTLALLDGGQSTASHPYLHCTTQTTQIITSTLKSDEKLSQM